MTRAILVSLLCLIEGSLLAAKGPGHRKAPQPQTFYTIGTVKKAFNSKNGKCSSETSLPTISSQTRPEAIAAIKKALDEFAAKSFAEDQRSVQACGQDEYGNSSFTSFKVIHKSDKLLVFLLVSENDPEGAAHGSISAAPMIWDIARQTQVKCPLFAKLEPKQARMLDQIIKRKLNAGPVGTFNEFASLKEHPIAGWYPNGKGITLFWSPYQIAAFAYGTVDTAFSFEELKPFMTSEARQVASLP